MSERQALVLSGGGAYAAYEVGVMKALIGGLSPATSYRPIDPHIVTGTSAGSFNAAMFVARWQLEPETVIAEIERVWLEDVAGGPCGNGVFRWRANPLNFFDLSCFLDNPARFFWRRVEDVAFFTQSVIRRLASLAGPENIGEQRLLELLDFSNLISTHPFPALIRRVVDFCEVRRSDVAFQAIATNWRTGELMVFENRHLDHETGPLIVMASSAIPGIFPPVEIPPEIYVDGGVLMNTPLSPAIRSGATHLHVVYLDPDVSKIPLAAIESSTATLQRTMAIAFAGIMNRDIENARRINRGLVLLEQARSGFQEAGGDEVRDFARVAERIAMGGLRQIEIHRYHPSDLLGSALGVLSFGADESRALIERGFHDAIHHDCRTSGCVLPSGRPTA